MPFGTFPLALFAPLTPCDLLSKTFASQPASPPFPFRFPSPSYPTLLAFHPQNII